MEKTPKFLPVSPRKTDLTGRVYGKLTVGGYAGDDAWWCRCTCGRWRRVAAANLVYAKKPTKTCGQAGCRSFGPLGGASMTRLREYVCWAAMVRRCRDPKKFPRYAGKGVAVCRRWLGPKGFLNFLADMGPRPSLDHSIDRADGTKGYSPSNCRWANRAEQNRNRVDNRWVVYKRKKWLLTDLAVAHGLDPATLGARLTHGWGVRRAVETPARLYGRAVLTYGGVTKTVQEWAAETGLSYMTLYLRVRYGWPEDRIFDPPRPRR